MRSFSAALVVLLLTSASTARGRERVAVASFKMIGAEIQDPTRQAQARTSLVGGLAASDLEVVPAVEVQGALAGAPELANCDTTPCLRRIGELTNARWVV